MQQNLVTSVLSWGCYIFTYNSAEIWIPCWPCLVGLDKAITNPVLLSELLGHTELRALCSLQRILTDAQILHPVTKVAYHSETGTMDVVREG